MSRLVRCNRCGTEGDVTLKPSGVAVVDAMAAFSGMSKFGKWSSLVLSPLAGMVKTRTLQADLCEDCTEILVEQFLVGGAVAPITQPLTQVVLPHEPMTDCQLVWNPGKGRFLCYHEDPELYHALILDNAQNVAEGVPERKICSVCLCVTHKGKPCSSTGCECVDKTGWVSCTHGIPCGCTSATGMNNNAAKCSCPCHLAFGHLADTVKQLADDVRGARKMLAGVAQRCSVACSEAHTYREGCLLSNLAKDVPGQIMPPTCGAECDPVAGNHTNQLGTCLNNPDTSRAIAVVCPVCKSEGSLAGIIAHMAEHGYQPDYTNAQWVDQRGYNLDGRLISQQGEDLTEAYSEQEPADEESGYPEDHPAHHPIVPQQRDSEE